MHKELEALQNAVNYTETPGLAIHEHVQQDKRKTAKKYFLQLGSETLSPVLDYENMNHFILGFSKAKKLFSK